MDTAIGTDGRAHGSTARRILADVRFLSTGQRGPEEQLLWSRDIRFVHRLAAVVRGARVLELESGTVLIASGGALTELVAAEVAGTVNGPEYGLVAVDGSLPSTDRYLVALASAVRLSGLADRIGMAQSTQGIQTKMLDYFFSLRKLHTVAFQPIVELTTGRLHEYECLARPEMPMLPQSIGSIVLAAINTGRAVELDGFLVSMILERIARAEAGLQASGREPRRYAVNLTPTSLLDPSFDAAALAARVRAAGLKTQQITIECTEQQAVADVVPLQRQVKALRRLGFGFAVDDAGAGYASFALIAALRPSIIKIDREIVHGIARDDAKQALVEAFVSFGRRIGARLLAEGIDRRADLAALSDLGVDLGQGFLLGRPTAEPGLPRRLERLRVAAVPKRSRVPSGA
jgi:EAL domain-containing protein (putative c-di-GMP-specific phosphodiesterase class I)